MCGDSVSERRISLRRPGGADERDLRRLLLHPDVQAWLRPPPLEPLTSLDVQMVLQRDIEHWRVHGFGPWLVHQQGVFRGRVGVQRSEVVDGLELAWAVMPGDWGRGIATRAARAALALARERELGQIVAFTVPHNGASVRVMEHLGMTREGEISHGGLQHVLYRVQ